MHVHFPYVPISIIYLFVYISRWRFKSLSLTQWTIFCSVNTFKWSYACLNFITFIILNNSNCVETSNVVLDRMIVVHLCVGFTFCFPKVWLLPYPHGFFNPVRINGKKINDMICNKSCKRNVVKESFKNSTFFFCTFCDILWHNCLG
jgi:hypothetical protein